MAAKRLVITMMTVRLVPMVAEIAHLRAEFRAQGVLVFGCGCVWPAAVCASSPLRSRSLLLAVRQSR